MVVPARWDPGVVFWARVGGYGNPEAAKPVTAVAGADVASVDVQFVDQGGVDVGGVDQHGAETDAGNGSR